MKKHFFIDDARGELFIWNDETRQLRTIERVLVEETVVAPPESTQSETETPQPTTKRRCGQCGKVGHSKPRCAEFSRTETKPKVSGEHFMLGLTFEQCDKIADDTDGMKGETLKAYLENNDLTPTKLYNIRSRVKKRWNEESDAKRGGTPATSREGQNEDEPAIP